MLFDTGFFDDKLTQPTAPGLVIFYIEESYQPSLIKRLLQQPWERIVIADRPTLINVTGADLRLRAPDFNAVVRSVLRAPVPSTSNPRYWLAYKNPVPPYKTRLHKSRVRFSPGRLYRQPPKVDAKRRRQALARRES